MAKNKNIEITFEDHGQDFLRWTLDSNKIVIDCQPFQYSIWAGAKVLDKKLKEGQKITILKRGTVLTVKYPLVKIMKGSEVSNG